MVRDKAEDSKAGPYAISAQAYVVDGMPPLPLKPGTKRPVLAGYHGWEGKWVDAIIARKWARQYGNLDVAIRLPKWIICFDVDDYEGKAGGQTLKELEAELGPLPDTIRSTARWGEGQSGIKWFRVPPKYQDKHWAGIAGPGIEIVSWFDRVAVVWPSTHHTGKQYRWYDEETGSELEWPEWDIPELPLKWCRRFTDDALRGSSTKVSNIPAWLKKHASGKPCAQMIITNNLWSDRFEEANSISTKHDVALRGIRAILGDCAAGHTGAWDALANLRKDFMEARAYSSRARRSEADVEWRGMVKGAVELVAGEMKPVHRRCYAATESRPEFKKSGSELLAGIKNGSWLNVQTFAPLEFAIPQLIPEGLSVLAGPPKAGKSVILLQFGLSAARGGELFGMEVDKHKVLYLALEDSDRRMQQRCRELMGGEDIPDWFDYLLNVSPGELIDTIHEYIKEYKQYHPLVMVDTLGKILEAPRNGEPTYERDYRIVCDLKTQADHYPGSAVLASRHTKKGKSDDWLDLVSGTNAIAGAADTILALQRMRGSSDGVLHVTGRDLEDSEFALKIDRPLGWALDGEDMEEASRRMTTVRTLSGKVLGDRSTKLVVFVEDNPEGVKPQEIADELGISIKDARTYIDRSLDAGRIRRISRGVYGPIAKQSLSRDDKDHGEDESPFG